MKTLKCYSFATLVLALISSAAHANTTNTTHTNTSTNTNATYQNTNQNSNYQNYVWPNAYGSISGDVTWANHGETGGGGNIAIGSRFVTNNFGNFRAEIEGGYHDISPSHYFTYMGNVYYDLDFFKFSYPVKVVPYIGVGLGDATVHYAGFDAAGVRYSAHDDVFAYQGMAGFNFVVDQIPNTDWFIGYRYLGTSNTISATDKLGVQHSTRINAHNAELGVRFHF